MTATTFIGHFQGPDTHTNRPAAAGLPNGTLYVCTTHNKIERTVSGAWADYATLAATAAGVAGDPVFNAKGDLIAASGADVADRLPVGTDAQVLTADSSQTLGVKWATPAGGGGGAWTLISTTTLASPAIFDVSSISGSYNDLLLVLIARQSSAGSGDDNLLIRFNANTSTNYYSQASSASGTTTVATSQDFANTYGRCARAPLASALASSFSSTEIILHGYASTSWFKNWIWQTSNHWAASSFNFNSGAGQWIQTAAITRIQILDGNLTNLATSSQLRIYGRT